MRKSAKLARQNLMRGSRRDFLRRAGVLGAAFGLGSADWESRAGEGTFADSVETVTGIPVSSGDWPWWRGPTLNNVSTEKNPPLEWGPDKNVLWKVKTPGRGHSSPITFQEQVFIATADEEHEILEMLCYQRADGKELWRARVHQGGFLKKHDKNSHASATAACDGSLLFFPALFNDALWVTALNLKGETAWQTRVSSFVPSNGYGSSPVLYKNTVIVSSDNTGEPCLMALDRKTGVKAWRTERPKSDNFSSLLLARLAGRDQLIICGARMIASYEPADGKQIWFAESPTEVTATTMAFGDNLVVGGGNVPVREYMCVSAGGKGDVTKTHLLWRSKKNVSYVPAPMIHEELLYIINDSGIAACLDPKTEREFYKERLDNATFTASPFFADGKIFATSEGGKTFVLQAGKEFKILGSNELKEETLASPVLSRGHWFIRTKQHLYCIGKGA